jgi:hypothetical protein
MSNSSSLSPQPLGSPLSDAEREAVRALFSDHLEGMLDGAERARVDDALAHDDVLRAEHQALAQTLSLLHGLPRFDAPDALVGQVRDRLAAERRGTQRPPVAGADVDANVVSLAAARERRRARMVEVFAGIAAVAAVVAVVAVGVPALRGSGANSDGLLTAGSAAAQAVSLSWRAPGIDAAVIDAAASAAGLAKDSGAFVGDRQAAARFLIALKGHAASVGSDVSGYVPEAAESVVIRITP